VTPSSLPLVIAAALFLAAVLWRVRPAIGYGRKPGASKAAVDGHLRRAEAAKDDRERAAALCDAAELLATRAAIGLYLRALRADPGSVKLVERTIAGLGKRPRALESVLWRHLSTTPWVAHREASALALDTLRSLYESKLRNHVRARFVAHAREALVGAPPSVT